MIERLPQNRLVEDLNYYNNIIGRITEELERLATLFDDDNADAVRRSGRKSWGEMATMLKSGEKLRSDEVSVREIVDDVANNAVLSVVERQYLLSRVFNAPRFKKIDDD